MYMLNGVGTTCYGRAKPMHDTFVATEWFVIFFFPIWPIRCRRMQVTGRNPGFIGSTTNYRIYETVPLADNVRQVALTWAWTLVPLSLLAAVQSSTPGGRPAAVLLAAYVLAAITYLALAGRHGVSTGLGQDGWHAVPGTMLLSVIASYGASAMPFAVASALQGGIVMLAALMRCGRIRAAPAVGAAVCFGALAAGIIYSSAAIAQQLARESPAMAVLHYAGPWLWSLSLLLVASIAVPALRRARYWLVMLVLATAVAFTMRNLPQVLLPMLAQSGSGRNISGWTIVLSFIFPILKAIPVGVVSHWLFEARRR